jgi:hypothetical protein
MRSLQEMPQHALEKRLESLRMRHAELHAIVDTLEADRAPSEFIKKHKVEKADVKTQIMELEKLVENYQTFLTEG